MIITTDNLITIDVGEYIKEKIYLKCPFCHVTVSEFESTKGIINMRFNIYAWYRGEKIDGHLAVCFAKDLSNPDLQYLDSLAERIYLFLLENGRRT